MADQPLSFTADELDHLGRSADAMTAYMGKPVLAEVIDGTDTGFEWVIFAIPFDVHDDPDGCVRVQVGGEGARLLGNTGGVALDKAETYDCQFLWAIQLSDLEGVRFIKVNDDGEEVAWSDRLEDILPFNTRQDPEAPPDEGDEDTPDKGFDDPADEPRPLH